MLTVSTDVLTPSLTATWKTSVVFETRSGAVNVGAVELTSLRTTVGPDTCDQVYVSPSPSGSVPLAASVTVASSVTDWSGPAFAVGASSSALTVIVTVSIEVLTPSLTATWKTIVEFASSLGAMNVGAVALALLNETAGPLICVHA